MSHTQSENAGLLSKNKKRNPDPEIKLKRSLRRVATAAAATTAALDFGVLLVA